MTVWTVGRAVGRALAKAMLIPLFRLLAGRRPPSRRALIWGPVPIINIKYWSAALREAGWESRTLVSGFYASINRREDYDLYYEDLVPAWVPGRGFRSLAAPFFSFAYVLRHARVLHIPFSGGPLGQTFLWRSEADLLRRAGIRTVVLPYGADVFMYSRITDPSVRNALLRSYPAGARVEEEIAARVGYWSRHADVIIVGFTMDGLPRWDLPVGNMLAIDVREWTPKPRRSANDGWNGPVRVLHAPNHRGVKGTEYIIEAVEALRAEGLDVELVLLEGMQNEQVKRKMLEVDIMADQLILPGYGMAAVEAMATGLPVLSNLEDESYTRLFRRQSFLGECPIVSASPDTVADQLRALVTRPDQRHELGVAGRRYVEMYHSYETARYMFGAVYEKILEGSDRDLATLFHPLRSSYARGRSPVAQTFCDEGQGSCETGRTDRSARPDAEGAPGGERGPRRASVAPARPLVRPGESSC